MLGDNVITCGLIASRTACFWNRRRRSLLYFKKTIGMHATNVPDEDGCAVPYTDFNFIILRNGALEISESVMLYKSNIQLC